MFAGHVRHWGVHGVFSGVDVRCFGNVACLQAPQRDYLYEVVTQCHRTTVAPLLAYGKVPVCTPTQNDQYNAYVPTSGLPRNSNQPQDADHVVRETTQESQHC